MSQHNKLNFKFDKNSGLIFTFNMKEEAENVFDSILNNCKRNKIDYVFIGDTDHRKTEKDKLLEWIMPSVAKSKFDFGIEDYEFDFIKKTGKQFSNCDIKDISNAYKYFLGDTNRINNKRNAINQAEKDYNFLLNAKKNNVTINFLENGKNESKAKETFIKYKLIQKKESEYRLEQYWNENLSDTLRRYNQIQYNKLDSLFIPNLESTYIAFCRDSIIQFRNRRTIVYRGFHHIAGQSDLDQRVPQEKKISIWLIENDSDLGTFYQRLVNLKTVYMQCARLTNIVGIDNAEIVNYNKYFYNLLSPEKNRYVDIPDYILFFSTNENSFKMYETITYLKHHDINGRKMKKTPNESIYDYLTNRKLIN